MIAETTTNTNSDYSFRLCYWLLKPIGAWPPSSSTTKIERFISFALIIICYGFMLVTIIPSMLNLFLEDENFITKMKVLGPLGHWCIGCVNYTTLILRSKEICYCVNHMETDWRNVTRLKDQQVMMKNANFGRYAVVFYAIFMQTGLMCHCFVTAFNMQVIQVGNETIIVHQLPCAMYKELMDANKSPAHEIVLFTQFLSVIIVNTSAVASFSLVSAFAAHACGELGVVMVWITEFVNGSRERKETAPFKEIGVIVEHHLRALNFISYVEEMINPICFLELFRCILAVCVLGFYTFTEWTTGDVRNLTTYFLILVAICFNTFVMCYIGELLVEQCEKVGQVVYMTDWYHLPEKRIADLILIISRSSIVVHLTAWKLIHMSIYTFGNVMKSAFAYLNLLCQAS